MDARLGFHVLGIGIEIGIRSSFSQCDVVFLQTGNSRSGNKISDRLPRNHCLTAVTSRVSMSAVAALREQLETEASAYRHLQKGKCTSFSDLPTHFCRKIRAWLDSGDLA